MNEYHAFTFVVGFANERSHNISIEDEKDRLSGENYSQNDRQIPPIQSKWNVVFILRCFFFL